MARPLKEGIDYFPFDVSIFNDRKFRKVKMRYGYLGIHIYLILISMAYAEKGYYIDYSEKNKEDVAFDILDKMQGKHQPTIEVVFDVIEELVTSELFSPVHFKTGIITSKRLQSTFYGATVKRDSLTVNPSIWLLSVEEMTKLSGRSSLLPFFINNGNNLVNDGTSTQSKEKKSKVNKSKVKESKETVAFAPPSILEIEQFCKIEKISVNPAIFYNYYNSKDWFSGKYKMRDWRSSIRLWEERDKLKNSGKERKSSFTISELETLIEQEQLN